MHENFWPHSPLIGDSPATVLEDRGTTVLQAARSTAIPAVLNIEHYSDAANLFRVTAWILRRVNKQ